MREPEPWRYLMFVDWSNDDGTYRGMSAVRTSTPSVVEVPLGTRGIRRHVLAFDTAEQCSEAFRRARELARPGMRLENWRRAVEVEIGRGRGLKKFLRGRPR